MDYPAKAGHILTNDKGGGYGPCGGDALGRYLLDQVAYLPYNHGQIAGDLWKQKVTPLASEVNSTRRVCQKGS
jgi:hypothetical protein